MHAIAVIHICLLLSFWFASINGIRLLSCFGRMKVVYVNQYMHGNKTYRNTLCWYNQIFIIFQCHCVLKFGHSSWQINRDKQYVIGKLYDMFAINVVFAFFFVTRSRSLERVQSIYVGERRVSWRTLYFWLITSVRNGNFMALPFPTKPWILQYLKKKNQIFM